MVRCPFPYANDPICDQTIAQSGGSKYNAFLIGWLVVAIILFVIHVIQYIRMVRIRGWNWKLLKTSYLHQVYTLSLINVTSILIRSTDPNDYAGRLNFSFYHVMQDLSTWAAYSMIMLCVCSWVKIMRQITGRSTHPVEFGERITLLVSWMYFFSFTLMFAESQYSYIALFMVLMFCVLYASTLIVVAWTNGYQVYRHLVSYERAAALARENKPSTGNNSTNAVASSPTLSTKKTLKTNSVQKKKTSVIVILKLLVIMTTFMILAILAQLYYAIAAIQNKYHHTTNPDPYPQWTFFSLVTASAFMIVQTLCSMVCLFFFRKFGNDTSDHSSLDARSQTDGSQSKPHKINTHRKDSRTTRPPTPRKGTNDLSSHHIALHDIVVQGSSTQLLAHDMTRASVETGDISTPVSRPTLPPHPHPAVYTRATSTDGRPIPTSPQMRASQSIAGPSIRHSDSHPFQPNQRAIPPNNVGLSNITVEVDTPTHSRNHSQSTSRKIPASNHI